MKTLFSLIIILALLFFFGAAKVLLRTNPILALSIISGSGVILAIAWIIYPKIKGF